jgi:hypothetical protein
MTSTRILSFFEIATCALLVSKSSLAVDTIGTDLYDWFSPLYQQMLHAYDPPDDPLWIAETSSDDSNAKFFFYALGNRAIGFEAIAIDHPGFAGRMGHHSAAHAENYALVSPMARDLARLNFEGKLETAVEESGRAPQEVDFSDWQATVSFGYPQANQQRPPGTPDAHGRVLIVRHGPNEFLVSGIDVRAILHLPCRPSSPDHHINNLLQAEQGQYINRVWKPLLIWNGDETRRGLNFLHEGNVIHTTVYRWD